MIQIAGQNNSGTRTHRFLWPPLSPHTIIPVNLLPNKINHFQLEVFESKSTTVQLFPEPRLLRCGYCNQDFPRSSIAYHVFYGRSGLMFEFLDQTENDQNDTYKEYVRSLFFFLSLSYCSLSLVSPFSLPKGINLSGVMSYYQNCRSIVIHMFDAYTPAPLPGVAAAHLDPATQQHADLFETHVFCLFCNGLYRAIDPLYIHDHCCRSMLSTTNIRIHTTSPSTLPQLYSQKPSQLTLSCSEITRGSQNVLGQHPPQWS